MWYKIAPLSLATIHKENPKEEYNRVAVCPRCNTPYFMLSSRWDHEYNRQVIWSGNNLVYCPSKPEGIKEVPIDLCGNCSLENFHLHIVAMKVEKKSRIFWHVFDVKIIDPEKTTVKVENTINEIIKKNKVGGG